MNLLTSFVIAASLLQSIHTSEAVKGETFIRIGLDTNISKKKKALNFFLKIFIKIPKFLQNLL